MAIDEFDWLVSTNWLAENLGRADLVVFDASWHLPSKGSSAKEAYLDEHIKDALFFDIDSLRNTQSDLPHMLPSPVKFSSRMRRLGVGDGMTIVIYDRNGIYSAPRAWWTLRTMGFDRVKILNGGLKKWLAENRPVDDLPHRPRIERHFTAMYRPEFVCDVEAVKKAITDPKIQIIDARPQERFEGRVDEPRKELRRGHMPGAVNLPFHELIQENGTLKSKPKLESLCKDRKIDLSKQLILTCGSGVTASILFLAFSELGAKNLSVYDGSWAEWGANYDLPLDHASLANTG